MTEIEFRSLAQQGYNRIPLIAEAFADLETPLSLYLKLVGSDARSSFLLESVVGGERFGRYSFIGLPARTLLRAHGFRTEVVTDGAVVETHEGNPARRHRRLAAALSRRAAARPAALLRRPRRLLRLRHRPLHRAPPGQDLEGGRRRHARHPPPAMRGARRHRHLSGRLYLIVYADPTTPEAWFRARRRLAELTDKLATGVTAPAVKRGPAQPVEREFAKPTTSPRCSGRRSTSPRET
jgi:anthranilate synthase component 1